MYLTNPERGFTVRFIKVLHSVKVLSGHRGIVRFFDGPQINMIVEDASQLALAHIQGWGDSEVQAFLTSSQQRIIENMEFLEAYTNRGFLDVFAIVKFDQFTTGRHLPGLLMISNG